MMDVHEGTNAPQFVFNEATNSMVLSIPASAFQLDEYNGTTRAKCFLWTGGKGPQTLGTLDVSGVKSDKGNGVSFSFRISDPVKAVAAGIRPEYKPEVVPQHVAEITGAGEEVSF